MRRSEAAISKKTNCTTRHAKWFNYQNKKSQSFRLFGFRFFHLAASTVRELSDGKWNAKFIKRQTFPKDGCRILSIENFNPEGEEELEELAELLKPGIDKLDNISGEEVPSEEDEAQLSDNISFRYLLVCKTYMK